MIKITDIAYVRLAAPNLDAMEQFTQDFGLVTVSRDETRLFTRGTDPEPYVHVTERGEPGFRAIGFEAASAEDLVALSQMEGASAVEKIDAPGGGQLVRLADPDGHCIEVVHGRELLEPLPAPAAAPLNTGRDRVRLNELQRVQPGACPVKRLGHAVMRASDAKASLAWYRERFGLLPSDDFYAGEPENVLGTFLRCDRGDIPVDHHTFLCVGPAEPGFDHAAFEVQDFDAVMTGHDHLVNAGYDHHAGIGRHFLGSQVFDYWKDPWGHVVEHFTDGDLLDASVETGHHPVQIAIGTQWGKFAG